MLHEDRRIVKTFSTLWAHVHQFAIVLIAHMVRQAGPVHVSLVALIASVRLVVVVLQQMELEVILAGEAV